MVYTGVVPIPRRIRFVVGQETSECLVKINEVGVVLLTDVLTRAISLNELRKQNYCLLMFRDDVWLELNSCFFVFDYRGCWRDADF